MPEELTGLIVNIQRYSLHDGAGIRTLIFMKGCPLKCLWCCNPESQLHSPQVAFMQNKCVGKGENCSARCVLACRDAALHLSAEGVPSINWAACTHCGNCADACYYGALETIGRQVTVADLLQEIEKDRNFYRRSQGGVTVGGGEPLIQAHFVANLLKACQYRNLHTAVETCGFASWERLAAVSEHANAIFFDVKHLDPEVHKQITGVSNDVILENLARLLSMRRADEVTVRIPVIPGLNDSESNITKTAQFVAAVGGTQIELMPYHRLGASKYEQHGMEYTLGELRSQSDTEMEALRAIVRRAGLRETTGTV